MVERLEYPERDGVLLSGFDVWCDVEFLLVVVIEPEITRAAPDFILVFPVVENDCLAVDLDPHRTRNQTWEIKNDFFCAFE